MKPAKLMNHLNESELKRRMKAAKDHDHFQRWQSIYLTSRGLPVKIVAEYVGSTTSAVHRWVHQYNHYGPDGFERPPLITPLSGFDYLP